MRPIVLVCFLTLAAWIAVPATARAVPASAPGQNDHLPQASDVATSPTAYAARGSTANDIKVPKDKPNRSKKNPNDDKDQDPDDGNAGGGNDNKTVPNDGAEQD